ncbi:MAG: 4-(cytidine 5'-diphospho)-2-C-methyl-D-erythritol kinase [Clostridia bacterium]|nr:4-(cytidine 5'-diphospho)-2-C-methyl-D-erythritol kinase [Clostridia bacterium]
MTLTVRANAKINLFLDVVGKREDGYHDIVSVMQSVSLCDTLTVAQTQGDEIAFSGGGLPNDETNLVVRAARAYFALRGKPFGVRITLDKQIPMAAGLGGGSADAAATLKALNALDGDRFTVEELAALGAGIGADVPFCVWGGTCLCHGIGERISPLASRVHAALVVAIAGEGVSTPQAFGLLDRRYQDYASFTSEATPTALINAMQNGDLFGTVSALFNRFEEVTEPLRPAVSELKAMLMKQGALGVLMSGSGPAVFGIFPDAAAAKRAADQLKSVGVRAYDCHTVESDKI